MIWCDLIIGHQTKTNQRLTLFWAAGAIESDYSAREQCLKVFTIFDISRNLDPRYSIPINLCWWRLSLSYYSRLHKTEFFRERER